MILFRYDIWSFSGQVVISWYVAIKRDFKILYFSLPLLLWDRHYLSKKRWRRQSSIKRRFTRLFHWWVSMSAFSGAFDEIVAWAASPIDSLPLTPALIVAKVAIAVSPPSFVTSLIYFFVEEAIDSPAYSHRGNIARPSIMRSLSLHDAHRFLMLLYMADMPFNISPSE